MNGFDEKTLRAAAADACRRRSTAATWAGIGAGVGAVLGAVVLGPVGAALVSALGGALGGYTGEIADESLRRQAPPRTT